MAIPITIAMEHPVQALAGHVSLIRYTKKFVPYQLRKIIYKSNLQGPNVMDLVCFHVRGLVLEVESVVTSTHI
jgi:hypothetical protein